MKALTLSSLAALALGAAFSSTAAAAATGIWYTEDQEAQVEVSQCGDTLCGTLVWLAEPLDEHGQPKRDLNNPDEAERDQEIVGLRMLWDMKPEADGTSWRGGRVYDPESGRTYRGQMRLEGDDQLVMRGYVGTPLLGRSTTWTRASDINQD